MTLTTPNKSLSPAKRRAYRTAWRQFQIWARGQGLDSSAPTPAILARYLGARIKVTNCPVLRKCLIILKLGWAPATPDNPRDPLVKDVFSALAR